MTSYLKYCKLKKLARAKSRIAQARWENLLRREKDMLKQITKAHIHPSLEKNRGNQNTRFCFNPSFNCHLFPTLSTYIKIFMHDFFRAKQAKYPRAFEIKIHVSFP